MEVAIETLADEGEQLRVVKHAALPLRTAELLAYCHEALEEFLCKLPDY